MSELDNKPYDVSYIASAPEDLKLGDRVEVIDAHEDLYQGRGEIIDAVFAVRIDGLDSRLGQTIFPFKADQLRKLSDATLFLRKDNPSLFGEDSDNVKAFKAILNEMAETYKAKDADYGSAYDEGYRLFGHTQLLSRIYEKFSRVKHMLDGNKPNVAENIYDTLTDMAVQAICLRMLLQKNDFENVD